MSNLSLVEKYRPSKLNNILEQKEVVTAITNIIKNKNMPHLLFYGSPGTGKTSIANILTKKLFKNDYEDRVLELNASDERGIQIVRGKIKHFAKLSINQNEDIKFKIIILDEADSLTNESQLALRYIIEHYSKFTRFIIICNYINKLINPIISRCALFRFKPIKKTTIYEIVKNISEKENIEIKSNQLSNIFFSNEGDLRQTINTIEKFKFFNQNFNSITNIMSINLVEEFLKKALNNNIHELVLIINSILNKGYSANELLINLIELILKYPNLSEKNKCNIIYNLSFIDYKLNNGGDDFIQLFYLANLIYNI